ncbi:hypothetical protein LLG46_10030 [bacterium]|nr:hypothetical protein [bacterium]
MNRIVALAYVTIMSCCLLFAPIAAQAVTSNNTITITATCTYNAKTGSQTVTADCILTVIYPAGPGEGPETNSDEDPVYITGCWRRVVNDDGTTEYIFHEPNAVGRLVRAFVWDNGTKKLVDGIQAEDGTVVVDGVAYERVPGM